MRPAGHQAVCLTKNPFRIDRALQQLYFPFSTHRSFSASTTRLNSEAHQPVTRHVNSTDHPSIPHPDTEKTDTTKVLSDALAKLRIRNRGYDSTVIRKVHLEHTTTSEHHKPMTDLHHRNTISQKSSQQPPDTGLVLGVSSTGYINPNQRYRPTPIELRVLKFGSNKKVQKLKIGPKKTKQTTTTPKKNTPIEKEAAPATSSPLAKFRNCEPVFDSLKGLEQVSEITVSKTQGYKVWEYHGHPVHLSPTDKEIFGQPQEQVDVSLGDIMSSTPLERLGEEMQQFLHYIMPSDAEKLAKQKVSDEIFELVLRHTDKALAAERFGSTNSGYELCYSDIDLRLFSASSRSDLRNPSRGIALKLRQNLDKLVPILKQHGFENVQLVHARYPLISARHGQSQVDVQIVASNSAEHVSEFVREQMAMHQDLYPVYALVRTYLALRGLTDVYQGGLGAYTLIMMIIASLKLAPGSNPGESLINFFRFYSSLDTYNSSIGIIPPKIDGKAAPPPDVGDSTSKEQKFLAAKLRMSIRNREFPWFLCLQDPCDKNNDLGRRAFAWKHIQATFQGTLKVLESCLEHPDKQFLMLGPLVGPAHKTYVDTRLRVEQYAFHKSKPSSAKSKPSSAKSKHTYTDPKTFTDFVRSKIWKEHGRDALDATLPFNVVVSLPLFSREASKTVNEHTFFLHEALRDNAGDAEMVEAERKSYPLPIHWREERHRGISPRGTIEILHQHYAFRLSRIGNPWFVNESVTENLLELNLANDGFVSAPWFVVHKDFDQSWNNDVAEAASIDYSVEYADTETPDLDDVPTEDVGDALQNLENIYKPPANKRKLKPCIVLEPLEGFDFKMLDFGLPPAETQLGTEKEPISDKDMEEQSRQMFRNLGADKNKKNIAEVHELVDKGFFY